MVTQATPMKEQRDRHCDTYRNEPRALADREGAAAAATTAQPALPEVR